MKSLLKCISSLLLFALISKSAFAQEPTIMLSLSPPNIDTARVSISLDSVLSDPIVLRQMIESKTLVSEFDVRRGYEYAANPFTVVEISDLAEKRGLMFEEMQLEGENGNVRFAHKGRVFVIVAEDGDGVKDLSVHYAADDGSILNSEFINVCEELAEKVGPSILEEVELLQSAELPYESFWMSEDKQIEFNLVSQKRRLNETRTTYLSIGRALIPSN